MKTEHPGTTSVERVADLAGMALAFGLVARALYAYDDRAWLDSLSSGDIFAETPFGGDNPAVQEGLRHLRNWTAATGGALSDEAFEELKLDYTRLFVTAGPEFVSPWESVYFNPDRLVFQEETLEVRNWYRRFGLEPRELHHEPDDHIALELAFVARLAEMVHDAAMGGNREAFRGLLEDMRGFLSLHLLRWAPEFFRRLALSARTEFFRGIALIGRGFVEQVAMDMEIQAERPSQPSG